MSAKVSLEEQLQANEAERVELLAKIAQEAHQAFPKMIYKDLEGDGDVSNPSNQRTVGSEDELKKALSDGWKESAEEAAGLKDSAKAESRAAKSDAKSDSSADRAEDRAEEAKFERDSDKAASKKKGR